MNRTGESKTQKEKKGQETEETREDNREDTTTGIYKGDNRDTYRHRDKDNRKQEWSLC